MGRRGLVFVLSSCLAIAACDSRHAQKAAPPAPTASQPTEPSAVVSAAPSATPPPATPIDEAFRRYQRAIPPPATLSDGNGIAMACGTGEHVTYNRLDASARAVPIRDDADLPRLVHWARDPDPCVRQIALQCIRWHVDYDGMSLSVPTMHDVEHPQFHDILLSLKRRLDARHVAYDPAIFEGLVLAPSQGDFVRLIGGRWEEEVEPSKNFRTFVSVGADTLHVASPLQHPDPKWPEVSHTIGIARVRVDAKGRFVVDGAWEFETTKAGDGPKQPTKRAYSFLPVKADVAWFDDGRPGTWLKLRRVAGP